MQGASENWKYSYGEAFLCPYELAVRELESEISINIIVNVKKNDVYLPDSSRWRARG